MTTVPPPTEPDLQSEISQHANQVLGLATSAATTAMIVLGDRLNLYECLADGRPVTSVQLAELAGVQERYVREWLSQQTVVGILHFDPNHGTFRLPPSWAALLTDPAMIGICLNPAGMFRDLDALVDACRNNRGLPWGEHDPLVFESNEKFWGGQYREHLVDSWIPAVPGLPEKLAAGALVADIGTGHGAALIMLAEAFPASRFVGFDSHGRSITTARERAVEAGVADRITFEQASCEEYPGQDYDLITFFDTLHDLGDPVGAAAYARQALARDGELLLVEPQSADDLTASLENPAAPIAYAASTFMCVPNSLSQTPGAALGAQAGETRLRAVLRDAGCSTVDRVADTPFNMVFHIR